MSINNKSVVFCILFLIVVLALSCSSGNVKEEISISPVPAVAGQIESSDDLIEALEEADSEEIREKLLEDNRDMVKSSLVIDLLWEAKHSYDEKTLSMERPGCLIDIAIEVSEFLDDKISLAKSLTYKSNLDMLDGKEYNPPSLQKALELFMEAGDRKGEGVCYYWQARNLHYAFGDTKKALEIMDKAINIFEEMGDNIFAGDSFYIKGDIYRDMGEKDKAIKNFSRAVEIYGEEEDIMHVISTYEQMAITCETRGFLDEAEAYLEKERLIIEEFEPESLKDFSGRYEGYFFRTDEFEGKDILMADYYLYLGQLYSIMGKYEEAIKCYKKNIELGSKLEEPSFSETMAYLSLGGLYSSMGQKENALKYYLEAMEKTDENTSVFIVALNYMTLGHFYLEEKVDTDKAMEYYSLALEKSQEIEMTVFREQYVALCIRFIGQVYEEEEDFPKAIEKYEEALEIFEKVYNDYGQFDYYLVWNYDLLGRACHKNGDSKKALEYMTKALEVAKETKVLGNIGKAYKYLGNFYLETDRLIESINAFGEAVKVAEEIGSPSLLWEYYFSLGKAYEKDENLKEAYNAYSNSIEVIENMRNELRVEEFKRDFMKDKIEVYEHMIDVLIKMDREEEAFFYNEKARARAFLDILANQKVDITHGVSPDLIVKEDELKTRIQFLSSDIRTEKNKAPFEQRSAFINETDKELKKLKMEYEEVLNEIKMENPEYTTLITVSPYSLKEIQSFLDEDTVIMEYFLAKDKGFLWIISNDSFNTVIIEHKREDIVNIIRTYRESACDNITVEKIGSNEWRNISEELYGLLFQEGEKFISGKKRIFIAPHRILHYFPFQVLIDEDDKLLIEKYDIAYLPSASVLKFCQNKNHLKKDSLLAFELGNMKVGNCSPLPGTTEEVEGITPLFSESEVYSGKDMKVGVLEEKADGFDILHFATHGIMDSESPLFSGLVFADKRLNVYEIFSLDLDAYMVTLSACRTGLFEDAEGDEFVGLSRAFIYAGSPSICSSLWDVSDVSTGELMEKFYFYLREHNKSEALRLAQLDLQKKYSHPFFWAPFILTGDYR